MMMTFQGRHRTGGYPWSLRLLLTLLGLSVGAAVARADDRIYWSAEGAGAIQFGNLNGTGTATTMFGSEGGPCGVAIDAAASKI